MHTCSSLGQPSGSWRPWPSSRGLSEQARGGREGELDPTAGRQPRSTCPASIILWCFCNHSYCGDNFPALFPPLEVSFYDKVFLGSRWPTWAVCSSLTGCHFHRPRQVSGQLLLSYFFSLTYYFIESQNNRTKGWKRPQRSSSPIVYPAPPGLLHYIPKCHMYMLFSHLQGWWLHQLPGQHIPISDHSFSKEFFPNFQSKPPLMQLEAIASRPITSYLGEGTNTCLTTTSSQVVVEILESSSLRCCHQYVLTHFHLLLHVEVP